MPSKEDMMLAGKLVLYELVPRETIEQCLRAADEHERPLHQILLKMKLVNKAEINGLKGVPLTKTQPIPDYRFERKIAEGGMAEVYLAIYKPIKEEVALKVMKPELARLDRYRKR
ncbi:MAG: hypothetical protein ACYTGV_20595, partial [Planctomycetota bacterium]